MGRSSEKSGLHLNPMFYWQYVKGSFDRLPCILVKGNIPEGLVQVLNGLDEEFEIKSYLIVEDGEQVEGLKNVLYRERARLTDKEWLKGLSNIDILLCDKEDEEYWMIASLCGVKVIFKDDFKPFRLQVLSYVERIENWEWAKNLLTQQK